MTPERIQSPRAAEITGLSQRSIQDMAARGELPGAARLGGRWTFDELALRRWIKQQETVACRQTTFISGAAYGGAERLSPAASIAEAYELVIGLKPRSGSPRGGKNLSALRTTAKAASGGRKR